jgi:hypothetical protein
MVAWWRTWVTLGPINFFDLPFLIYVFNTLFGPAMYF